MTIDEYKAEYPQDAVFIQVDDTERTMTDEEYETWVSQCVYNINHPMP
jgi:phenylalanyl-tRNA synthetase beta subunit